MVSSVSGNSTSLSQLMLLLQQQQAQLNAVNPNNAAPTQGGGGDADAVQGLAGGNTNNRIRGSSPGLGGFALAALLQNQQAGGPGSADASGLSSDQEKTFRQDFKNLMSSIKSGDLAGAQQAYTALSQFLTANKPAAATGSPSSQNPFQQALSQIGSDLQAGDIAGAQQTLTALQQSHEGHHHHHGGGGGGAAAAAIGGLPGGSGGADADGDGDGDGGKSSAATSTSSSTQPGTVTEAAADGSVTTVTTRADGSVTTTTTPASQTASAVAPVANILQDILGVLEKVVGV